MHAANDNAVVSLLPADIREMLDRCDEAGVGMDFVIDVLRTHLRAVEMPRGIDREMVLASVRRVFERGLSGISCAGGRMNITPPWP